MPPAQAAIPDVAARHRVGGGRHGHWHDAGRADRRGRLLLTALLVPLGAATLVGLVLLWPATRHHPVPQQFQAPGGGAVVFVRGTVTVVAATRRPAYFYDDMVRDLPLGLLAGLFAVVVVAVARWRGLAALVGLGVAYAVLVFFLLPALLAGEPALPVGLTAAAAILFVVLYVAHGVSARSSAALLGTLLSLALTGGLAFAATGAIRITGLSSDVVTAVQTSVPAVSVSGLVLCGLIIGALGVLNDVTVTQASAVWELHDSAPDLPRRRLYRAAMRIGRDHIASSVYALVLAYAGSAIPLLLLVSLSGHSVHDIVTSDEIAEEIVRSLVGGVGLVASVPITTAVATYLVRRGRRPAEHSV